MGSQRLCDYPNSAKNIITIIQEKPSAFWKLILASVLQEHNKISNFAFLNSLNLF